jgi:hypothetical protein
MTFPLTIIDGITDKLSPFEVLESWKKNYMTFSLTIINGIIDELKIH